MKRLLMGFIWFLIIWFLVRFLLGGIGGVSDVLGFIPWVSAFLSGPYADGQGGEEMLFFQQYCTLIAVFSLALAVVGTLTGFLPGTKKSVPPPPTGPGAA